MKTNPKTKSKSIFSKRNFFLLMLLLTLCTPAIAQSLPPDPLGSAYVGMQGAWPTIKNIGKWFFLIVAVIAGAVAGYQIVTGENKNGRSLSIFATFLVFALVFWLIIP